MGSAAGEFLWYESEVSEQLAAINPVNFMKMACGDLRGLRELAMEFFRDTRQRLGR